MKKLAREHGAITGAMNDLSKTTVNQIKNIKLDITNLSSSTTKQVEKVKAEMKTNTVAMKQDIDTLHENATDIQTALSKTMNTTNDAVRHIQVLSENQDGFMSETQTNAKKCKDSLKSAM